MNTEDLLIEDLDSLGITVKQKDLDNKEMADLLDNLKQMLWKQYQVVYSSSEVDK